MTAATLAVYGQVFGHGFVALDDRAYITANSTVRAGLTAGGAVWAFTTTHAANWHPLTWLSHMADVELFGLSAGPHHLVSVSLHLATALALFLFLRGTTGATWRSGFVAALFATHPLHVESVAWAAERKDVLCALFFVLAMWAYARYASRGGRGRYLLVALSFALALLSKPMAVTLPFALLLLDFWPLDRIARRGIGPLLLEKAPLVLMSAASCGATYFAQSRSGAVSDYPLADRAANAVFSGAAYLWKTVWPASLSVYYPHPVDGGGVPYPQLAGAILVLAGLSFLAVRLRRRHPVFVVGWAWYLGTLVPVIGLVQVGMQGMADRYTYLPLIGVFLVVAWAVPDAVRARRHGRLGVGLAGGVVVLLFAAAAHAQAAVWRDGPTLLRHAVRVVPGSFVAHNYLAAAFRQEGRAAEGIAECREALRIKPDYADAWTNLGAIYFSIGRFEDAVTSYREAIAANPRSPQAHYSLGTILAERGYTDEAIAHYREAIALLPSHGFAHNNLGTALLRKGDVDGAILHFREAVRLNPFDGLAKQNLLAALKKRP